MLLLPEPNHTHNSKCLGIVRQLSPGNVICNKLLVLFIYGIPMRWGWFKGLLLADSVPLLSIHLQCTEMEAEVSETNISKPGSNPKLSAWLEVRGVRENMWMSSARDIKGLNSAFLSLPLFFERLQLRNIWETTSKKDFEATDQSTQTSLRSLHDSFILKHGQRSLLTLYFLTKHNHTLNQSYEGDGERALTIRTVPFLIRTSNCSHAGSSANSRIIVVQSRYLCACVMLLTTRNIFPQTSEHSPGKHRRTF